MGLAGLWEQLALHKVLSPIPSSIQALAGCGGKKGTWPLVVLDAQPQTGSFAGGPSMLAWVGF